MTLFLMHLTKLNKGPGETKSHREIVCGLFHSIKSKQDSSLM